MCLNSKLSACVCSLKIELLLWDLVNVKCLTSICTLKTPRFSSMRSLMAVMAWLSTDRPSVRSRVVVVMTYRGGAIRLIWKEINAHFESQTHAHEAARTGYKGSGSHLDWHGLRGAVKPRPQRVFDSINAFISITRHLNVCPGDKANITLNTHEQSMAYKREDKIFVGFMNLSHVFIILNDCYFLFEWVLWFESDIYFNLLFVYLISFSYLNLKIH